ncbi:MAG: hypothetical protein PHT29_08045, partial [Eubacteriales bacterium]|nr:hypothetical protein [Eubacteriales bacterium]
IEMLIVIAIIAILAAIAIPTFSAQLDKANQAVDDANLRTATSLAVAKYMLDNETGAVNYSAIEGTGTGAESTMEIVKVASAGADPATGTAYPSKVTSGEIIAITVTDGEVTSASWQ